MDMLTNLKHAVEFMRSVCTYCTLCKSVVVVCWYLIAPLLLLDKFRVSDVRVVALCSLLQRDVRCCRNARTSELTLSC